VHPRNLFSPTYGVYPLRVIFEFTVVFCMYTVSAIYSLRKGDINIL
jgi:hypothetical protein